MIGFPSWGNMNIILVRCNMNSMQGPQNFLELSYSISEVVLCFPLFSNAA